MEAKRFNSNGRYSEVVEYNNVIYLSGVCAEGDEEGVQEQTRVALAEIERILAEHGSDKEHILTVNIFLRNIADFDAMNEVYDKWVVAGHEPTRACVEAKLAEECLLIEIVVSAYKA